MKELTVIKTGGTMPSLRTLRGDFEDWILEGMGVSRDQARVVDVAAGQDLPEPASAGAVVITGSHDMVTDRREWSEHTASWLAGIVAAGNPVLGICYGHQLLAHALGGTVDYNPRGQEEGTTAVTLLEAAHADALLGGLPSPIEVHVSHSQSVLRLPPGALRLAENAWDGNQAFRVGACAWGVQFHPEFDAAIMRAYARARVRSTRSARTPYASARVRSTRSARTPYAEREGLHPEAGIHDTPFGTRILRRFAALAMSQS